MNQETPQWLDDEITKRNNAMTHEENKMRKAANRKKPGAAKAGEPPDESDDEIIHHKPKKQPEPKPWDPMNRKVGEEPPRGWLGKLEENFGGCEDKDRKAGVMACFVNASGRRKNQHY